jgi:hypothetical protein
MKVIKADDYGFRKVIVVCYNPNDPEYIHLDSTPHPASAVNGCSHSRDAVTGLEDESVPGCRYNWKVREFVWNGEEAYTTTSTGRRKLKTNTELLDEIKPRLAVLSEAKQIAGLLGKTIDA